MKKFVAILAAMLFAMLAIVPVTVASAESNTTKMYVVAANGKSLNLRATPSTNGTLLAQLGVGYPVTQLSVYDSNWARVSAQVDGKTLTGYVMRTYLSTQDPTKAAQTFTKVSMKVTVRPTSGASGYVNLRAAASTSAACRTRLYKGEVLTVTAESNAFYQVRTSTGLTGYVVKAYVVK